MIQDIGPHRLYNQYERRTQPQPEDVVFAMENGKVLMKDSTSFPRVGELGMALPYVYLFAVDETRFFLLREPAQYPRSGKWWRCVPSGAIPMWKSTSFLPP